MIFQNKYQNTSLFRQHSFIHPLVSWVYTQVSFINILVSSPHLFISSYISPKSLININFVDILATISSEKIREKWKKKKKHTI